MEFEIAHNEKRNRKFRISDIKSMEVQQAAIKNKVIDLYGRSLLIMSKENCLRKMCTTIVGH